MVNSITKGARQRGLDTFFSCDFLPNENILGTLEKHECDFDNIYWSLAEEIRSGKFFEQNSPRSNYPKNREVCCTHIIAQKQRQIGKLNFFAQMYRWKSQVLARISTYVSHMDPHSSLSTYVVLTTCNAVYLKAFQLPNGFWISYAKQLELIPTFNRTKAVGEKQAILIFLPLIFPQVEVFLVVKYGNTEAPIFGIG